jgi:geranylgeranyl diphosphate/geranylgeranyl-bacteriochlorophyllide a reductase
MEMSAIKADFSKTPLPEDAIFDVVVVGGGPAGATAAHELAQAGRTVLLMDKAGRIKPCGGAIPPRLIRDFAIPDQLICARIASAMMVAPSEKTVDMPIDGGYVGMVDRDVFDEWLRMRAVEAGAARVSARFERLSRDDDGTARLHFVRKGSEDSEIESVRARLVIGADGANSAIAEHVPKAGKSKFVFAYHEIIRAPKYDSMNYAARRCDVVYDGRFSPDFYSWIFPHGETASIGTGSAQKGFALRKSVADLRRKLGLDGAETIRKEGAPIPLKPLKRWDNGKDILLVGDAAGVVAPSSGEGIYYAMACAHMAAEAGNRALESGDARHLSFARKAFMKCHGKVFFILGIMQWFWYRNDKMRERFVSMCRDKDVQRLTWESYMNKELVRKRPAAHAKIFFKDLGHLLGVVKP